MLKRFAHKILKSCKYKSEKTQPVIIPRSRHIISRKDINPNALKVLYRLNKAGFTAYLVGGCVRDLLLSKQPKDFDIATNAHPEEVRRLFKNSRLIGRRFRLAHIVFGREIIEVATFRTHHGTGPQTHEGRTRNGIIIRDNIYGTIDDDIWRRDFSINALYYNIADFSIIDYVNGMQDIKLKRLSIIGDPLKRFREDPVRLIRAVRFMSKLELTIAVETAAPLKKMSRLLAEVPPARLFQEVIKIFHEGHTATVFKLLEQYNFLEYLFAQTTKQLSSPKTRKLLELTFVDSDIRTNNNKKISTSFLLSAILWSPISDHYQQLQTEEDLPKRALLEKSLKHILAKQIKQLSITRNVQAAIREIILLQHDLTIRRGKRPIRCLNHPRFRAAYDLLALREKSGEAITELAHWWEQFQTAEEPKRNLLLRKANRLYNTPRKRRTPAKTSSKPNQSEINN